ncbi:MAG: GGDEF domain-containing protein [Gammaproteobacteria bacterium]|nr:GGDEF domain-containing protein [Gammaproteobacteria bacterium]MBI5615007.1 GGDEF domain-containing protein [Gammaproteobacteria bacterium]
MTPPSNIRLAKGEPAICVDTLRTFSLFRNVDLERVRHLLERCAVVDVDAHHVLLEEGAENSTLYLLLTGELEVSIGGTPIVALQPGVCVGELSILSQLTASACVTALRAATLLAISDDNLWALIRDSHDFACNLLGMLSGRMRDANERLRASLSAQERAALAASLDPLTGLYNRRWLDTRLERDCAANAGQDTGLVLLMADLDAFKPINDNHGHLVGDEVLRAVAAFLQRALRAGDCVARFGGEEFAVLVHDIDENDARELAERLRAEIAAMPLRTTQGEMQVTVSIGLCAHLPGMTPAALVHAADVALYAAKRAGRNRVVTADDVQT